MAELGILKELGISMWVILIIFIINDFLRNPHFKWNRTKRGPPVLLFFFHSAITIKINKGLLLLTV